MLHLIRNEDGSILVEAAVVLPVLLLCIIGGFDLYTAMLERLTLQFATQGGSVAEANTPGTGVAFATSQLPAAKFSAAVVGQQACVNGSVAVQTVVLPQQWFGTMTASACWPIVTPPTNPPKST